MFPTFFDLNIYREQNHDLIHLSNNDLITHFNEYGKHEGRISSLIFNRKTLTSFINTYALNCLEIGPFDCPVLTGQKVKYFDVLDQTQLIQRSVECNRPHPIDNIPFINYVDNKGNLNIINDTFDLVLSCHSIEHQLDFIQHLQDVSKLLNHNGYYVILLPDKRYCFDHFIKESTIADILDSHLHKKEIHSLKSVIEHRSLTCHNDSIRHWNNDHGNSGTPDTIISAIKEYKQSLLANKYLDVHSLQFTPESFEKIINTLNQLSYIDLIVDNIYPTIRNSNEFYVILKKK